MTTTNVSPPITAPTMMPMLICFELLDPAEPALSEPDPEAVVDPVDPALSEPDDPEAVIELVPAEVLSELLLVRDEVWS